jgi:hypothetical protein
MTHRSFVLFRVLVSVVAVAAFTSVGLAGQSQTASASPTRTAATKPWTPPLTPDGQPDLQGVWLNNSATPLERPKALEGRTTLSDEEVTELRKRAARLFNANGDSDFAGGDNLFLAVLANPERYTGPNRTTSGADEMIEREFDNRTSLIVEPPDGKIPSLTPQARERIARSPTPTAAGQAPPAGPEDLSNNLRCITYGTPRIGLNNFNGAGPLGYYQILQAPGYVILTLEAIHETRIIALDGRPHISQSIRQWNGDSRGRWEGNTLVVETTNFSSSSNFLGSAGDLHLVERLTRTALDAITYEITVSDPTTWIKPWTAVIRLKQSQAKIYEFACHEGNYHTMSGMLAGARAEEKAAEEAGKGPK